MERIEKMSMKEIQKEIEFLESPGYNCEGLVLSLIHIFVESPFTFEQEAKQGTYLWLSAYPIPKDCLLYTSYNLRWTTSLRKKHSYKCCKERPS